MPEYELFGLDRGVVVDYNGNPSKDGKTHHYNHPDYRWRSRVMRGKNWMCAGDSAMFLDPLLSQGVTLAIYFGRQIGEVSAKIAQGFANEQAYQNIEKAYVHEIEVLNKVVSLWYKPEFDFDNLWLDTANKISNLFGRPIGKDIESFRWISNLENIHHLIEMKEEVDFLQELNKVNTINAIHTFENNNYIIK